MDNTGRNNNQQLQQQPPVGQTPQQPDSTQAPPQTVPASSQQPLAGNIPPASPSVPTSSMQQSPAKASTPRITLDDLYGPSGFATDDVVPSSPVPQPVSQPQSSLPTQSISPTPRPAAPVAPVQPMSSQVQQELVETKATSVPSSMPVEPQPAQPVATIPDLPTVSQDLKTPSQVPVNAQDTPQKLQTAPDVDSKPADMPLRKQSFAAPKDNSSLPPKEPPSAEETVQKEKPGRGGINKLFLLRIIAGIAGGIILLLLIIFGIKALTGGHAVPSGKVTLTYWGLWEDSNTMQSVISQFEQQHPDITVNYEKQDPKQYSQRLLTRIQQGNGPDIYTYHSSWLPMMQASLVPLPTSVVSRDALEKDFYPVVRNDLVKNGALYGVPLEVDTLSLFVNNKLFQDAKAQVPTTWDTFTSTARALTVKDANGKIKIAGAAIGTFDNITHAPDILSMLFLQNGVDISKMTPESNAADALTFYTSFAQGDSSVWDSTLDPSQLAFAKGNVAMYFGYSWDVFAIKAANPDLDFSVYPVPHLPGREVTAASYWVDGVSSKSAHQQAALTFLQYLAQKNTAAILYSEEAKTRLFGEPYAQMSLGSTLKDNPLIYPFVSQAQDAKSSFFAGETYDTNLNGQMNGYLGNAVRSVLGNTSAQSAIDTLTEGVLQIEKQYGAN